MVDVSHQVVRQQHLFSILQSVNTHLQVRLHSCHSGNLGRNVPSPISSSKTLPIPFEGGYLAFPACDAFGRCRLVVRRTRRTSVVLQNAVQVASTFQWSCADAAWRLGSALLLSASASTGVASLRQRAPGQCTPISPRVLSTREVARLTQQPCVHADHRRL